MPKANIMIDSTPVGNIAFETQHFHAIGGPEFPKLIINLELSLCAYQEYRQSGQHILHPLTLVLLSGEFCSPQDRGVAEFRDDIGLHASDMSPARTTQVRLQIPLDIIKVGRIEQSRSGNLQAALTFRPLLAMHSQDGAVRSFRLGGVDGIVFAIPKSQWIEQLLPQLGYGRLELIEVRIADAVRQEGLPQAVQELRQAQKQLIEGNWEEAVGHCRKVIEAIPESRNLQLPAGDRSFGTKVDTLIGEHLKAALGERQARFVAEQMKLLWGITSKAAHTSSTDYFKRADAEFLVRNTMALVEFFGKMLS